MWAWSGWLGGSGGWAGWGRWGGSGSRISRILYQPDQPDLPDLPFELSKFTPKLHSHGGPVTIRRMRLKSLFTWGAPLAIGVTAGILGHAQPATELQVGDAAPAFSLEGSDGKTYQLADFKGKKAVVLAWFPKAFTGG